MFKTLWTEPAGNISELDDQFVIAATFGEKAYSKLRYFVVAREMQGCCLCLTLNTYTFRGTLKERLRIEDYAVVYPAGSHPSIGDGENLVKDPFPIIIEEPQERLSPMSRLNFGRVYTVEHNIKVMKVGRINQEFLPRLKSYFVETINGVPAADIAPKDNAADASSFPVAPFLKEASNSVLTDTSLGGGGPSHHNGPHIVATSLTTPDDSFRYDHTSGSEGFKTSSTSISLSNENITTFPIRIRGIRGKKEKIDSSKLRFFAGLLVMSNLNTGFKIHKSHYFRPGEVSISRSNTVTY